MVLPRVLACTGDGERNNHEVKLTLLCRTCFFLRPDRSAPKSTGISVGPREFCAQSSGGELRLLATGVLRIPWLPIPLPPNKETVFLIHSICFWLGERKSDEQIYNKGTGVGMQPLTYILAFL